MMSVAAAATLTSIFLFASTQPASAQKSGQRCTKAGAKTATLICSKKAGRLVWAKAPKAAATTKAATAAPDTTPAASATSAASAAPAANSLDGTYKATSASQVGYRAKEVLFGQNVEGVGRTNAVTGSLTIAGTTISAVELTADLTKLKSDSDRRDGQVNSRILQTAKYPNATIKVTKPIALSSIPADGVVVEQNATVTMTVKDVTKDVPVSLKAKRSGSNIEVTGSIPVKWSDWNIEDPSFKPSIVVEDNGTMEFLIVFAK
jgi:polyisoprenoid-binding protein YceI